jgi:hypothetical protein
MERNAIGKKKFANGIIYIITFQLSLLHIPAIVGPIAQEQEPLCLDEDIPLSTGDGGGIRPMDDCFPFDFLLELVAVSTF